MPTDLDWGDAIDRAIGAVPESPLALDDLLAAGRRRVRRRRLVVGGAGVAAAALVVGGGVTALTLNSASQPSPTSGVASCAVASSSPNPDGSAPPSADLDNQTGRITPPAGWRVTDRIDHPAGAGSVAWRMVKKADGRVLYQIYAPVSAGSELGVGASSDHPTMPFAQWVGTVAPDLITEAASADAAIARCNNDE